MFISKILELYYKILMALMIFIMIILVICVSLQVAGRYIPFIPRYLWTVEFANFSLIWLIFLGSIVAVKEEKHFYVNFFFKVLNKHMFLITRIFYYFIMYSVSAIFICYGYRYFLMGYIQKSDLTGINLGFVYVTAPLAGLSWFFFLSYNLFKELKKDKEKIII